VRAWAVIAAALALASPGYAQTSDAPKPKAACRGADAKPCAPAKPKKKKPAGDDGLKAQSFTRCRDVRTHGPTKCGGPYAEPLPSN
jgi:hypothetical protein